MIEKRVGVRGPRYVARYRSPEGAQRSKTFTRKVDAEAYLVDIESAKRRGDWVDPRRGKVDTASWVRDWLEGKANLAPKTRERYEGIVRTHIEPRRSEVDLGTVTHAEASGD